jgi:hypothetical protein
LGSETVHTHDYKSPPPSVDPGAAKLRVSEIFGMSLKVHTIYVLLNCFSSKLRIIITELFFLGVNLHPHN